MGNRLSSLTQRRMSGGRQATWFLILLLVSLAVLQTSCAGLVASSPSSGPGPQNLTISNASASSVTSTSAAVTWLTNLPATSQIEYGTSTSYGSTTTLDSTLVTNHQQSMSGLNPGTLYHFRLRSRDSNNNEAVSGDMTVTTASGQDTQAPTVSIVAPAGGATVSGNVAISANASDNVGVAGVQFRVDGNNLGGEDTSAPYSVTWDTRTASNGSHTLTAVARDATGNSRTSASVGITVSNGAPDTTPPVISNVASNPTSTTALITWTTNEASDSQIEYGTTTSYGQSSPLNSALVTSHSVTLTGLLPSTQYNFRVRSRDAAANAAISQNFTFTTQAQGSQTSLGALAASMQPRTWAQLTTANASILLKPGNNGDILEYSNRGAWDPAGRRLYFCGASHHASFLGDCVAYDESSNRWNLIAKPLSDSSIVHGYDHNTFDTLRGRFYFRQYNSATVLRYDPGTDTWTSLPPIPWVQGSICNPAAASLVYFPDIDRIVFLNSRCGFEAYFYNPATNSWISRVLNAPEGEIHGMADYLPGHGIVIFGGGNSNSLRVNRLDRNLSATAIPDAPVAVRVSDSLMVSDPVTGNLLLLGGNGSVYEYRPASNSWSQVSGVSSRISGGFSAIAASLSNHGVIMLVKTQSGANPEVWLYKHSAGAGSTGDTTPPVISAVSATNVTTSSITVNWTTNEAADSQVEYGTTTSYGQSTTLSTQLVTSHSQTLSNLSPSTLYHYRVRSRDASGNVAVSGDFAVATSGGGDSTPPVVSITSPAPGSTVSGTASVTALATDNVGVTGVQFLLDGVSLGGEDTTTPYSTSWNTATFPNGNHAISARARDAAGNSTTSVVVTVTVSNTGGGTADFQTRCNAPSVVRCFGFDSSPEIAGNYGDNVGTLASGSGNGQRPVIDAGVFASGGGSLRFTIPSNSPADSSGSFFANFSANLATQFGPGEEFYVQWRQQFSPEMLRRFRTVDGGLSGWKQVIVGEGDQVGQPIASSCTELELVLQQDTRFLGPNFYHSCGRFISLEYSDGTQIRMQHQGPPNCYYPNDPLNGCFRHVANEWMTFQMSINIGSWNTASSRVRIWAARQGQPSVLIFDTNLSHPQGFTLYNNPGSGSGTNPGARYGKVWLLTYHTRKDSTEAHPTALTWYDELIISRARIQDPQ